MTPQVQSMLKQASHMLANARLLADVTQALTPTEREELRQVQRQVSQLRDRATVNPFMELGLTR